ncbi:Uncharacterised protein [Mycobacteroides abscessus]|nr:Uncharacterised protein [Mycobacteroides abscessus]SKD30362.1 Uncharacterised protein [Mycobacteroides abscessus subsp. massiliense]CPU70295.1 Uncharacterised protein [Mycobacteroides abscessus]CPV20354.1 Uncharacterised protein [Mycobacteroides abscessus]CPV25030.1 Uncharacterised protein [Mycobacteroides abscessus]
MSTRHGSATVVLPSDTRILIARSFDAPAALIFPRTHRTRAGGDSRTRSGKSARLICRIGWSAPRCSKEFRRGDLK